MLREPNLGNHHLKFICGMCEPPIPVVDFSACALTRPLSLESEDVKKTLDLLAEGLEQKGCVYLINHGLDTGELETLRATARAFFSLPDAEKMKCFRKMEDGGSGWIRPGMEMDGLLKECYNINLSLIDSFPWPDDDVVLGFREVNRRFMKNLNVLARRLFQLLGVKYSPQDPTIFSRAFKDLETEGNSATCLRSLYYPPLSQFKEIPPGQLRCGEHTDFDMFTFLLQDSADGLQALGPDGEWFDVSPLDGAVMLQAGDLLERWTTGRIKAVVHRVVTPSGGNVNQARECTTYFLLPDNDFVVKCLDGSDKYSPITSGYFFNKNMQRYSPYYESLDEKKRGNLLH